MGTHRRFSPEFKLRMVMEVVTGAKRPSEVCREHKLKDSQLLKWRKQFADNAVQVFEKPDRSGEKARIAELERTVDRQALENEILKSYIAAGGQRREWERVIRLCREYPTATVCRGLGIPRSSLYYQVQKHGEATVNDPAESEPAEDGDA